MYKSYFLVLNSVNRVSIFCCSNVTACSPGGVFNCSAGNFNRVLLLFTVGVFTITVFHSGIDFFNMYL